MRALSCLSVVGVQILVIVDQLDLNKKHNNTVTVQTPVTNRRLRIVSPAGGSFVINIIDLSLFVHVVFTWMDISVHWRWICHF